MISIATTARIAAPAAPGLPGAVTSGAPGDFAGALTAMMAGGSAGAVATGVGVGKGAAPSDVPLTPPVPDAAIAAPVQPAIRQEPVAPGKDLPAAGLVAMPSPTFATIVPVPTAEKAASVTPTTAGETPVTPTASRLTPPALVADPSLPATVMVPAVSTTTAAALATSALTPVPIVTEATSSVPDAVPTFPAASGAAPTPTTPQIASAQPAGPADPVPAIPARFAQIGTDLRDVASPLAAAIDPDPADAARANAAPSVAIPPVAAWPDIVPSNLLPIAVSGRAPTPSRLQVASRMTGQSPIAQRTSHPDDTVIEQDASGAETPAVPMTTQAPSASAIVPPAMTMPAPPVAPTAPIAATDTISVSASAPVAATIMASVMPPNMRSAVRQAASDTVPAATVAMPASHDSPANPISIETTPIPPRAPPLDTATAPMVEAPVQSRRGPYAVPESIDLTSAATRMRTQDSTMARPAGGRSPSPGPAPLISTRRDQLTTDAASVAADTPARDSGIVAPLDARDAQAPNVPVGTPVSVAPNTDAPSGAPVLAGPSVTVTALPAAATVPTATAATAPVVAMPGRAAGTPAMQVAAAIMAAMPAQYGSAQSPQAPATSAGTVQQPALPVQPVTQQAAAPIVSNSAPATPLAAFDATSGNAVASVAVTSATPAPTADQPPAEPTRWAVTTTPVTIAPVMPQAVPMQPGMVASAAQVFGAAMQALQGDTPRGSTDPVVVAMAGLQATAPTARIAEIQQAPLDMRQERWPETMIARIEVLRDAANATDTRMRLIPDALGSIDVSVKQDGDTVHVQFTAEQPATRALLQDAQPRLTELAESRGLKLTQTGVAGGGVDAGAGQQRQPTAQQPATPAASPRARAAADSETTDTRLA